MTLCNPVEICLCFFLWISASIFSVEERRHRILRKVVAYLPNYTASYFRIRLFKYLWCFWHKKPNTLNKYKVLSNLSTQYYNTQTTAGIFQIKHHNQQTYDNPDWLPCHRVSLWCELCYILKSKGSNQGRLTHKECRARSSPSKSEKMKYLGNTYII
jgi:hypothetical protein